MIVFNKSTNLLEVVKADEVSPVMAENLAPMGRNYTDLRMVYSIADGKKEATYLEVQNHDYDPNGEEIPGSPDNKREQEHYASVMSAVRSWLTGGE